MPYLNIRLQVTLPQLPTTLGVREVRVTDLGDAIASGGDRYQVDLGHLDETAVEEFIGQWGDAFREHARMRRQLMRDTPAPETTIKLQEC